jgi:hypothetical protein
MSEQIDPEDSIIIAPKSKIHGDELIIIYFEYIKECLKDYNNIDFIEIGSERGTGSTHRLAKLCNKIGWNFITVDADKDISKSALSIVKKFNLNFTAIHELGEKYFLKTIIQKTLVSVIWMHLILLQIGLIKNHQLKLIEKGMYQSQILQPTRCITMLQKIVTTKLCLAVSFVLMMYG